MTASRSTEERAPAAPNLVSTPGIGGVAIGFAFKDIFQNFLAGILILVTRPFRVGDQIVFKEYEGTVEDIQTRATSLKTYDGRRVIIPNGELYTNSLTVNTAFPRRRWQYDVGIGYGLAAQDRVLTAVKRELVAAGIDLPFPTRQVLFHDQSEATDGDRRRQREGWPAGPGETPPSRSVAAALHRGSRASDDEQAVRRRPGRPDER